MSRKKNMLNRLKKMRIRILTTAGAITFALLCTGCSCRNTSLAENTTPENSQAETTENEQNGTKPEEQRTVSMGSDGIFSTKETDPTVESASGESISQAETTVTESGEAETEATESNEAEATSGEAETTMTESGSEVEFTKETVGQLEITPKETEAIYDGTAEDVFFQNSVFVGDSVMMGFRNYILKQAEGFLGSPEFLVSGSYSLRMALNPVSDSTIHPIYQGKQRMIWDSMKMMEVDKAFIALGLNDIGMLSVDRTYENYLEVMKLIYEVNPDISIYVISTTNIYKGSEKGSLNNENVRLLNQKMKEYCETSKEKFIDIADYLIDEEGYLKEEYCSDNYVHQTPKAYDIWVQVLRKFASEQMQTTKKSEETQERESSYESVPEKVGEGGQGE